MQLERILLWLLVFAFGFIGGIGWILLHFEIKPESLPKYLYNLITSIFKHWFHNKKEKCEPITNPEDDTNGNKNRTIKKEIHEGY